VTLNPTKVLFSGAGCSFNPKEVIYLGVGSISFSFPIVSFTEDIKKLTGKDTILDVLP
jgi:hypothetical protein